MFAHIIANDIGVIMTTIDYKIKNQILNIKMRVRLGRNILKCKMLRQDFNLIFLEEEIPVPLQGLRVKPWGSIYVVLLTNILILSYININEYIRDVNFAFSVDINSDDCVCGISCF